jgi:flagellar basal-body rod protein FlgF
MIRGFYMLGSGMLTQDRVLDTISNNLANVNTAGFKKSSMMTKAFGDMVMDRMDQNRTPIGDVSLMNTADASVTDYSEGDIKQTGRNLDFAIRGDGFFAVQTPNGTQYTRDGSFNLDDQGYLVLNGKGRILGTDGQPIRPGTEDITADSLGDISAAGNPVGKIGVFNVANEAAMVPQGEGLYTANGAAPAAAPNLLWQSVENSNVNVTDEITQALASQRQLQSCSSAIKMYDDTLDKAVDISKV